MNEKEAIDLRVREIYVNLKNYDFEVHGSYKMDKSEASKFISWFEEMEGCKDVSTSSNT